MESVVYKPTTTMRKDVPLLKLEPIETKNKNTGGLFLYCAAITASLLAMSSGMAFAWTSPVLPRLNGKLDPDNNPLGTPITPSEESWIAGLLSLGSAIGPIISGSLLDTIGQKKTLLFLSLPMASSFITLAFSGSLPVYYIARLVLGMGAGGVFTCVPIYLNEISEDKNRGKIGCLMSVFLVSGFVIVYSIGPFLTVKLFNLICTIPLIFFAVVFVVFCPETPIYYIAHDKYTEAEVALKRLRSKSLSDIQDELIGMQDEASVNTNKKGLKDLFRSRVSSRGLKISCGLILLQQFAGINVVLGYLQSIFEASSSSIPSDKAPIIIGILQLGASLCTSLLVDRLGRRSLLMISVSITAFSLFSLGTYFSFKTHGYNGFNWLPLASLILYIISFNIGIGALPWVMVGELFAQDIRSMASTITSVTCFLASFILTYLFPIMSANIGMAPTFWFLAFICVFGVAFVYTSVPETKGKSLQEIQDMLR